ncbi:MAG: response regulator transcription factor [Chloroflexi bacterium]|nr:response regulator transcription factor [Chloroflexota bacterium]
MSDKEVNPQKILVIDDHTLFLEGLVSLFHTTPDFIVVDKASSVKEGVQKALLHRPDIILMDFSLPDGTGLDATQMILDEFPECKIVFLTVYETDENLLKAIRLGARGYMLKNVSGSSLLASLRGLAQGEIAMSRKMIGRLVQSTAQKHRRQKNSIIEKLSPREIDILYELQNGASNLEIAQKFFLSENTIKHHMHNLLEKLGVDNRRQAGEIARQMELKISNYGNIKK